MFKMIEIRFVDIDGRLRAMTYPLEKKVATIEEAKKDAIFTDGINIDGSSIKGFTPIEDSDLLLMPIKRTTFALPYTESPKLACMCEIYRYGKIFEGDTRSRLKKISEELLGENKKLMVGPEPEFFLLKDGSPADMGHYADVFPNAGVSGLIKRFTQDLMTSGYKLRVHHHEVAPGQYEIELGYDDALSIADTVVNYKGIIRALAAKNGLTATFMPKPFEKMNGNGMHFHLSLWEKTVNGLVNLFSAGKPNELSDTGYHFIAGILRHAKALTAIVAPTVNSYKRLIPGFEAPVYIAWSNRNRSALVRIPMFSKNSMARFEYRCPDPSCNIYLALAAIIAAGKDGIDNKLEISKPVPKNIFKMTDEERRENNIDVLPGDLSQAIDALQKDKVIINALGKFIADKLIAFKKQEWLEYSTQVTDWDWKRYLDM